MSKKLSAAHFWEWFYRNREEYLDMFNRPRKEQAYMMKELDAHFRACSTLRYFGLEHDDLCHRGSLIINSGNDPSKFDRVDNFVAAAPYIPGWEIHALAPPRPADFLLEEELEEQSIDPDRLWCTVYDEDPEEEAHIIIHFYEHDKRKQQIQEELMRRVIYNLLGERTFFLEIGAVICEGMPGMDEESFIKIQELPQVIGRRKSSLMINKYGEFDTGAKGIWQEISL